MEGTVQNVQTDTNLTQSAVLLIVVCLNIVQQSHKSIMLQIVVLTGVWTLHATPCLLFKTNGDSKHCTGIADIDSCLSSSVRKQVTISSEKN
jgi:hypothetical protein